jgi:hypothetical protein
MSELDEELAKDEALWRAWQRDGVTENTNLAVDVFFYAVKKDRAEAVAEVLRGWNLSKVEINCRRTLLVFKGWLIRGVDEGTWSLEKLHDRTRRYVCLAETTKTSYDGCGAMMPDQS